MIFAPKPTFSHYNLKILRLKVMKNLTNLCKKFCESPPWEFRFRDSKWLNVSAVNNEGFENLFWIRNNGYSKITKTKGKYRKYIKLKRDTFSQSSNKHNRNCLLKVSISSTFNARILCQYFCAKKLQCQNVTRVNLCKTVSYEKLVHKILMKST